MVFTFVSRARSRGGEEALDGEVGDVGDDAVDADRDEALHFGGVVDGPDVDFEAEGVGALDEGLRDDGEAVDVDGDLEGAAGGSGASSGASASTRAIRSTTLGFVAVIVIVPAT